MRPDLGPPRELRVRRLETDHRRAMRRLVSAMTTVAGASMMALAVFTPHERLGQRLVGVIAGGAMIAVVWGFGRPSKRNLLGLAVLTWTMVVAVFVIEFYDR